MDVVVSIIQVLCQLFVNTIDNNLELFWAFTILFIVSHIGLGYSAFKRRKHELGKLNQNVSQMKDYSKRKRTSARILRVQKRSIISLMTLMILNTF